MTDFSKDKYMKLISPITYFVMSNQGIRRIILYRTLFKPTFALKTKEEFYKLRYCSTVVYMVTRA